MTSFSTRFPPKQLFNRETETFEVVHQVVRRAVSSAVVWLRERRAQYSQNYVNYGTIIYKYPSEVNPNPWREALDRRSGGAGSSAIRVSQHDLWTLETRKHDVGYVSHFHLAGNRDLHVRPGRFAISIWHVPGSWELSCSIRQCAGTLLTSGDDEFSAGIRGLAQSGFG